MFKDKRRKALGIWTILFVCLVSYCYVYWYHKYNKSFIWYADNLNQSYSSFIYMGRLLRTIAHNLINHIHPIVPVWDTTMGYGSDIQVVLGTNFFDFFLLDFGGYSCIKGRNCL